MEEEDSTGEPGKDEECTDTCQAISMCSVIIGSFAGIVLSMQGVSAAKVLDGETPILMLNRPSIWS